MLRLYDGEIQLFTYRESVFLFLNDRDHDLLLYAHYRYIAYAHYRYIALLCFFDEVVCTPGSPLCPEGVYHVGLPIIEHMSIAPWSCRSPQSKPVRREWDHCEPECSRYAIDDLVCSLPVCSVHDHGITRELHDHLTNLLLIPPRATPSHDDTE